MLMLEVVSQHKTSMGTNARRLIEESEAAEFSIGRLETCSWVLPQDYVSRVQVVLRCVNNMYFLERKGSAPLAINDRSRQIEKNRIVRLSPGDLILIDDIEILTSEVEPGEVELRPAQPAGFESDPGALAFADPLMPGSGGGEDNIMRLFGEEDRAQRARAPASTSPVAPAPNILDAQLDLPAADDDNWWDSSGSSAHAGAGRPAVPHPAPRPKPAPAMPAPPAAAAGSATSPVPPMSYAPTSHSGATDGQVTLHEILRGAGLDPNQTVMSPEVARQIGEVLRVVVGGTMEILKARNDIRRELRIPSTQLAPMKNNPLKFSADVDDALHKLFIQRATSYLDTVTAFREAFADIRHHQVALLKSVGMAFDHMLGRFDPKELEKILQSETTRSGILGLGGKSKPWEAYARYYATLLSDHEDTYRKLFGTVWAKAYETEIRAPRADGRSQEGDE